MQISKLFCIIELEHFLDDLGTTQLFHSQDYDSNNRVSDQGWQFGDGTSYNTEFSYNANGTLKDHAVNYQDTANSLLKADYVYDNLLRLVGVNTDPAVASRQYVYQDIVPNAKTTMQVATLKYPNFANGFTFTYGYDAMGNISTYSSPDEGSFTYTYDNQGQLTKAVNGSTTYTYSYDGAGNILSKSDGTTSHSYSYTDYDWRDLLTAYDGQTISYDGAGNPTSYYNGTRWTFTWGNGKRLETASNGSSNLSYNYTADGIRTSKTANGVTHTYYYSGNTLLRETYGSTTLDFFYDSNGTPAALKQNGNLYYYITNLQGDVIRLVDANGNTAALYKYDPFGNPIHASGSLATINPLRYRGYYYDSETGLYYLQSRYYDPVVGRFINADTFVSTGNRILGFNMFAYCLNNPGNYIDIMGINPEALRQWIGTMWWITAADSILPIGDLLFTVGFIATALSDNRTKIDDAPTIKLDKKEKESKKEKKNKPSPEPPDVTYPGDDPTKAPDGYEWKGPDQPGGKKGGYKNTSPNKKDSWHPDLNHPDGIKPHWDYNDVNKHKWRVFPDKIELVK